jgi:hypothetical protein
MQLDDFIENALVQIALGVTAANDRLKSPDSQKEALTYIMQRGCNLGESTGVSFDVAVITKASKEAKGGGKFSIFVVDAGVDGKLNYEREQISRIKFMVGVDKRIGYPLSGIKK